MTRTALLAFVGLLAATLMAPLAAADEFGTASEAKALLERAIVELRADKDAAIAKFNDPKGAFRHRDLYVFCVNAGNGITTAHPQFVGSDVRTFKDKHGKAFGLEMLDVARDGEINVVTYDWPRPGSEVPVAKESYVTKVADQVCGVGYYK